MVAASALECFIPCLGTPAQDEPPLDDRSLVGLLLADPRTALQFLGADTARVRGALIGMALEAMQPPPLAAVAARAGVPVTAARTAMTRLARYGIVRMARNVVMAVYPLSFVATRHQVEVRGLLRVHAMCGAAALAVPALLDDDFAMTTIRSGCAETRHPIRITAGAGRILDVAPNGAHLGWGSGCADSRFFADQEAARRYLDAHGGDPSDTVPVELAFRVLRRFWGQVVDPGGTGA